MPLESRQLVNLAVVKRRRCRNRSPDPGEHEGAGRILLVDELRAETGGTAFATWVVPRLFPIKRLTLGTRSQAKEIYFAPLHLHACRAMKHIPEATPAPGTPISRLAVVML